MSTPVSGPGQFSKRTDRAVSAASESLPNAAYGEAKEYQEIKSGAPMAQQGGGIDASTMNFASLFGNPADQVTPLDAETTQPDVPVTAGAALGEGVGPEALTSTTQTADQAYFATYLPVLEYIANQPGSSDAARNLVRRIKYTL